MSNGNGASTLKYNKVSFGSQIPPEAPEGEWEMTVVRGKSRVSPTKGCDPMLTIQVRLDEAVEPENEYAQGTTLATRVIFFDDRNPKIPTFAKKRNKQTLHDICRQAGLDVSIVPETLGDPENDLKPLIEALEGKTLTGWTTHRKNKDTGETMVEVSFRKPGSFASARSGATRDDDE